MSLQLTNAGLIDALQRTLDDAEGVWELGLFQNNITPDQNTVIGDLTVATFSGYSGLELTENWTSPAIVSTRAVSTADPVVQAHNGGGTSNLIYGYYVVDGSGVLQYAERDPSGPRLMAGSGDTLTVVPRLTTRSEP